MKNLKIAIFGLGYVGSRLLRTCQTSGMEAFGVSKNSGIKIDLSRADTPFDTLLSNLVQARSLDLAVITIPPQKIHPSFWAWLFRCSSRQILLSSTGCYARMSGIHMITEHSPLDQEHPRYAIEQHFLQRSGEIIRLSGIYGPDRQPMNWIIRGKIGNDDRQVNFIHVDDIIQLVLRVLQAGKRHNVLNLADDQNHTWKDIIEFGIDNNWIQQRPDPSVSPKQSVVISSDLVRELFPEYQYRDFWSALTRPDETKAS